MSSYWLDIFRLYVSWTPLINTVSVEYLISLTKLLLFLFTWRLLRSPSCSEYTSNTHHWFLSLTFTSPSYPPQGMVAVSTCSWCHIQYVSLSPLCLQSLWQLHSSSLLYTSGLNWFSNFFCPFSIHSAHSAQRSLLRSLLKNRNCMLCLSLRL